MIKIINNNQDRDFLLIYFLKYIIYYLFMLKARLFLGWQNEIVVIK